MEPKSVGNESIRCVRNGTIRFGIDAEIDKALSLFGRDDLLLSKIYWPKAFRVLVVNIFESLLDKPQTLAELSTVEMNVDREQLLKLNEELKLSTSNYIKVMDRRWIVHVLREMSLFRRKFGLGVRLPNVYKDLSAWPNDLEDKDDLSTSMSCMSLRDDVKNFIWIFLDEIIPIEKYCNLHYYGAIRSHTSYPIMIEVSEDYAETVKDRIKTVSQILRAQHVKDLLPSDVIGIKKVPTREAVGAIEEGFYTSGSPWKEGTAGGILKYGDRLVGITSAHVDSTSVCVFDVLCDDGDRSIQRFRDKTVDVAFFTFLGGYEDNKDMHFNLMPMRYIGAMSDVDLKIGEPVYKIGRSTGLTVGRLGSPQSTFRAHGPFIYEDHVQILWNDDGCRFASARDCGSLYCVKRGYMYVPIGIHRISDTGVSYGCSIWKAMEFSPENFEGTPSFANAPLIFPEVS